MYIYIYIYPYMYMFMYMYAHNLDFREREDGCFGAWGGFLATFGNHTFGGLLFGVSRCGHTSLVVIGSPSGSRQLSNYPCASRVELEQILWMLPTIPLDGRPLFIHQVGMYSFWLPNLSINTGIGNCPSVG